MATDHLTISLYSETDCHNQSAASFKLSILVQTSMLFLRGGELKVDPKTVTHEVPGASFSKQFVILVFSSTGSGVYQTETQRTQQITV